MDDPRKTKLAGGPALADYDWRELEPEQYEVWEGPAGDLDVTRREMWKALGAGLLLIFQDPLAGAQTGELLSTRLHVGDDGVVTLMTGKVEIGQGARTELTQVVAEELRLDPAKIRVVMGDTALVPDDGGTWGSLTTPQTVPVVRRAAAAAYKLLPKLKAGEQLPGVAPEAVEVVKPSAWKVCGTPLPRVNGRELVTGAHRYDTDQRAPGMLHGKVKRPPGHVSKLVSFDATNAEQFPGVRVVREGDFLGVTAPDRETADRAVEALQAEWRVSPLVEANQLARHLKQTAREPVYRKAARYPALIEEGSLEAGLAEGELAFESSYFVHNIAHVPLAPRAALAEWKGDEVTIRTGTQVPFGARRQIARTFGLDESQVRVITPDTGAGFGGKHRGECQVEAARLAKDAGRPVMLEWTREEEFTCSYARPAGLVEVRSAATQAGKVTAWDFHNYNSGASGLRPPYAFPNLYCGFHRAEPVIRQGAYRSLAAVANTFAREMQMEQMAAKCGIEPLAFRLLNLENARLKSAVERAAERFGWGQSKGGDGVGFGLAANIEKGSHLALCLELEVERKDARVRRVVVAMDCGAIINPDNLRNQVTGAVIQGIGGALFERLRYGRERITNPRLSEYRVPRFSDVPEIEVLLVDRRDQPSAGAGEAPITMVAPAIGAALFNATGQWRRNLPLLG